MITNYPRKGITPHIGTDGNWYIGNTNTGILANGQSNVKITEVTLNATDWDTDTGSQTIQVIGISANEADQIVTLIPSMESKTICNDSDIQCTGFTTDSLTLTATTIPTRDIVIYVAIERTGDAPYEVYSTEETVVGRWIDGKPIYQKTIIGTGGNAVLDSNPVYDLLLDVSFSIQFKDNRIIVPITYSAANTTSIYFQVIDHILEAVMVSDVFVGYPWIATVKYTKTTDTATAAIPSATALMDAYEEGVNEA